MTSNGGEATGQRGTNRAPPRYTPMMQGNTSSGFGCETGTPVSLGRLVRGACPTARSADRSTARSFDSLRIRSLDSGFPGEMRPRSSLTDSGHFHVALVRLLRGQSPKFIAIIGRQRRGCEWQHSPLVSPYNRGCSGIASGLLAVSDDKTFPYSWCCSSRPSLWKQPRSYSTI